MANQIRFKRASGSDPSASDLALGEPAVRTDTAELFFKKDDGTVAKVSGGGGIDDGDKGDITVSNSGATFTIDNDAVTFDKFQNIATGGIIGRNNSGTGSVERLSASEVRTLINVENGANNITNNNQLTNGAGYITATLTNEQVQDIVGSMVSGNTESGISVTYQDGDGTLDFVVSSQTDNNFTNSLLNKLNNIEDGATADQSASQIKASYESNSNTNAFTDALLSKLNGIAASATNVTNNNQLTNGAGYITSTLTNEQVQDIVGGMVTGNTESGITVTYQDGDGTLDFSVASQTDQNFTTTLKNKLDGIAAGAQVNVATNLGKSTSSTTNVITSSTGTNVTLNEATGSAAGLMSVTHHNKLDGIATGATNVSNNNQLTNGAGYITSSGTSAACSGNAATATRLQTARTIAGTSFNGTANINISYNNLTNKPTIPTNNNQLTNGAGYLTSSSTLSSSRLSGALPAIDGSALTNVSASGTVAGGAIYENAQSITSNYTITNGKNAMSAGPITIASGVTVTVGSGETYTIV